MKKQYLKSRPVCKVTFVLPREAVNTAKSVTLVGEFNGWDNQSTPLKKRKNGSFAVTLDLSPGKEYQYRYLINDATWENDWEADKYVPTPFGDGDNSVVVV